MTRFVVDADVALRLVRDRTSTEHALVAPALMKSEVLADVHRRVRAGELTAREAADLLEAFAALKVRYLSDRVSRRTALDLASELGDESTALAEYLAVTRLQADAFVTLDADRARRATGVVPVADYRELAAT